MNNYYLLFLKSIQLCLRKYAVLVEVSAPLGKSLSFREHNSQLSPFYGTSFRTRTRVRSLRANLQTIHKSLQNRRCERNIKETMMVERQEAEAEEGR